MTGSGKTEIYLRAVQSTLAAGRRAIVLVPEISLTAQTVRRFEARFPGRVAVIHSQLSLGQRYAVWDRIRSGEADVLIGPRVALFAPMSRLGLIVLDEAHDGSYKQSEPIPLPAYHARDVAIAFGRLTGCSVILGSATPSIETVHTAQRGLYHRIVLPVRVAGHRGKVLQPGSGDAAALYHPGSPDDAVTVELPTVSVVDAVMEVEKETTVAEVNQALSEAANRYLGYTELPLVSIDFQGDPRSSIVDGQCTKVIGKTVKVMSWYDNEWGYSNRMLDLILHMESCKPV